MVCGRGGCAQRVNAWVRRRPTFRCTGPVTRAARIVGCIISACGSRPVSFGRWTANAMQKFSAEIRSRCASELITFLDKFEEGTAEMARVAPSVHTALDPGKRTPPELHNHYVDLLISSYSAKYLLFAEQLLGGVNRLDFLAYAAAARSFVEMTAVLRHFMVKKYKPLFDASVKSGRIDLRKIIELHDQHLRGSRFDWIQWLEGDFGPLFEAAKVRHTKKADEKIADGIRQKQVNITTCVEKWAAEAPAVLVLYDLLCDMVHPNLGSNLAIASVEDQKLVFGSITQNVAAFDLFVQTFPWLVIVAGKSFSELLIQLAMTKYQDDEL